MKRRVRRPRCDDDAAKRGNRMKLRSERIKHRKHDGGDLRVFVTRPIAAPALRRLAAKYLWDGERAPPAAERRAGVRQADGGGRSGGGMFACVSLCVSCACVRRQYHLAAAPLPTHILPLPFVCLCTPYCVCVLRMRVCVCGRVFFFSAEE